MARSPASSAGELASATLILVFEGRGSRPSDERAARRTVAARARARAWGKRRPRHGSRIVTPSATASPRSFSRARSTTRSRWRRHGLGCTTFTPPCARRRARTRWCSRICRHAYPDGCSIYFTLVATRSGDPLARYDALIDSALGAALSSRRDAQSSSRRRHQQGTPARRRAGRRAGDAAPAASRVGSGWHP